MNNDGAEILVLQGNAQALFDDFDHVIFPADQVKIDSIYQIRRIQEINLHSSWKEKHVDCIKDNDLMPKFFQSKHLASSQEFEEWRLKQGLPFFSNEISGETNPLELGLVDLISLNKGCYLGQEVMARFFRSKSLKCQLRYWEAYGESNEFDIGKKFFSTKQDEGLKKNVGIVTSSMRVNNNFFKGLALIKKNFLDNEFCFSENGESITIKKTISFTNPF